MKRTFRQAWDDARASLKNAFSLLKKNAGTALVLCGLLYLLPLLLSTISTWSVTGTVLKGWEDFLHAAVEGNINEEMLLKLLLESAAGSNDATIRTMLISLLSSLFLVPLLHASLAQMNLSQMHAHTSLSANDAVSGTLHRWKSLIFLAILTSFLTLALSQVLTMMLGGLMLLFGPALMMALQFVILFFIQTMFSFVWLSAVGEERRGMAAMTRSMTLFIHHAGTVLLANLAVALMTLVPTLLLCGLWLGAFFTVGAPLRFLQLIGPIMDTIFLPLNCALSAVLYVYAGGRGLEANDPYAAPEQVHSIPSANPTEDQH